MSTPLWRQMYNAWEKAVTPGLQEVTASNGFRDLMALGMKANADIAREIERTSRQWLHMWNLPAATDVRKLRQQVTSLEREVMSLRHTIANQDLDTRVANPAEEAVAAPAKADSITMTTLASTNGTNGQLAKS